MYWSKEHSSSFDGESFLAENYPAQKAFFDGLKCMQDASLASKSGNHEEAELKAKEGIRQEGSSYLNAC